MYGQCKPPGSLKGFLRLLRHIKQSLPYGSHYNLQLFYLCVCFLGSGLPLPLEVQAHSSAVVRTMLTWFTATASSQDPAHLARTSSLLVGRLSIKKERGQINCCTILHVFRNSKAGINKTASAYENVFPLLILLLLLN